MEKKKNPKKLMKAFISEGQQVSKQSLRDAFDFPVCSENCFCNFH